MLRRFLLYSIGVLFGFLMVSLMFEGGFSGCFDSYNRENRIVYQIINSNFSQNEDDINILYNMSSTELKEFIKYNENYKFDRKRSSKECKIYKFYKDNLVINVKLCKKQHQKYSSEFF